MTKLIEQIKRHEGLRLKPYNCTAGKLTIGYGRNLESNGITEYEAEILLHHDINGVYNKLRLALKFWPQLNDARRNVLINMGFNIGTHGLLGFKKTLKLVEEGKYNLAAIEMLDSKWAKQVPDRALELSVQMDTGEFQ